MAYAKRFVAFEDTQSGEAATAGGRMPPASAARRIETGSQYGFRI
jgi:hypothetical protein